ncbi:MAG: Unknown protein, partial [uncultured Thiotrichaceae bacterium]
MKSSTTSKSGFRNGLMTVIILNCYGRFAALIIPVRAVAGWWVGWRWVIM